MPSLSGQQYFPKSRKRTKAGRYSHEVTYQELSQYFHLPTEKACQKLGVGLTILKRICRRFGLPRWPYKKPSKLAYSATPSTYTGPVQQSNNYNDPAGAMAANRHHLADTPAANYLRQQGYGQPSPFNTLPLPTGWQMPSQWPHQHAHQMQQLENLGCSRPIPRRIVPTSGERSIPEATLRAIGLSSDTNASHEAQTDRLDLLISAIDQSENVGSFGEWQGGADKKQQPNPDGRVAEPSSPASVNTLQGSPITSTEAPAQVPSSLCGAPSYDVMNSSEKPEKPLLLQAAPASRITTAATGTGPATTLTDALAQLTSNTGRTAAGNSLQAFQSLVEILAAHPELAVQFRQLLSQPKEPSAFTEQNHVYQQHTPPPEQQAEQQQQQNTTCMHECIAAASNEEDVLMHFLQRQQQLQQTGAAVADGAAAAAAAAALRRAQLSAKFQAMQAKLAARQAALQKLQSHMEMQQAFNGHQHQNSTGSPITIAPFAPPSVAISVAAGTGTGATGGNPTLSADITTNAAASGVAFGSFHGAGQSERREALFRLLAAKLQACNHQQQQQHQQ